MLLKGAGLALLICLLDVVSSQLKITNLPANGEVEEFETQKKCLHKLSVTDSVNSTSYDCKVDPPNNQFQLLEEGSSDCIFFVPGNGALTGTTIVVKVTCTNSEPNSVTSDFTVRIKQNVPPVVTSPVSEVVDVLASSKDDTIFTITASDADGDTLSYALKSPSTIFRVDPSGGKVILNKDIRSETGLTSPQVLTIEVSDSHNTPVDVQLTVTLNNINSAPQFTNVPTAPIQVKETEGVGSPVYKCSGEDSNTNTNLVYSAVFNPVTSDLAFSPSGCEITVGGKLNDEAQKSYKATITVSDGYLSNTMEVEIQVLHVPTEIKITNLHGSTTVKEFQDTDVCLYPLTITDNSGGYICSLDPTQTSFDVVKKPSDTEYCAYFIRTGTPLSASNYPLNVKCVNNDGITDTKTLDVKVIKNNPPDNPATKSVNVDISTATVAAPGSVIYTFSANDPDKESLTYKIDPAVDGFTMSNDGKITTTKDLRESNQKQVTMDVIVSDGNIEKTTKLTLDMINFNEPPVIKNDGTVNVLENSNSGTEVYKCQVEDSTTYGPIQFSNAVFTPVNDILVFDTNDCTIKIDGGKRLDYEKQTSYTAVLVTSDGFKSSTATVTVNVVDQNDPPEFTVDIYRESVEEGNAISITPIYDVKDPENNPVKYTLINSTQPGLFQVSNNGEITNIVDIDYEKFPGADKTVTLTLQVADDTSAGNLAKVILTIQDKNDNAPEFDSSSYIFNISLSTVPSKNLLTLKATDADSPQFADISYRLKPNSESNPNFFQVLKSGDVLLAKAVDVPYGTALTATVEAVDQNGLSTEAIIIGSWNKAPKIVDFPSNADVAEDQTEPVNMVTFKTTDAENDLVDCELQKVQPEGSPNTDIKSSFTIERGTNPGEFHVRFLGTYKFEARTEDTFFVEVKCQDGNGGFDTDFFSLHVAPNKQPTVPCSPTASATVSALNSAVDAVVYDTGIVDPENDHLTVTFTSVPDFGHYRYDSTSKSIIVKKDLRLEKQSNYNWTITVSDGKHKKNGSNEDDPLICVIDVLVKDLNVPPVFKKVDNTVAQPEDTPPETILHTFQVIDADNTTVDCDVAPITEVPLFVIDKDLKTIKLAPGKEFDYEGTYNVYTFKCTATDGYQSTTSTLTLSITDSNDKPYFKREEYSITVDEGKVGAVKALPGFLYDDEEKQTQTYTFSLNTTFEDSTFFEINPATGEITNIKELDVDAAAAKTSMELGVIITDSLGGSGSTKLKVDLRDINDIAPKFDPNLYQFKDLRENLVVGHVFDSPLFKATDGDKEDINKEIVYSLNTANEYFDVNTDGKLRLIKSLKGQYNKEFDLKVKATDTGINPGPLSSTAQLIFTWNEPPVIKNIEGVATVKEDQETAITLPNSQISFTDPESNPVECVSNGVSPNTEAFDVVKDGAGYVVKYTGRQKLHYRTIRRYTISIKCTDTEGGGSDIKTMTIDVEKNHDPEPNCLPSDTVNADAKTVFTKGYNVYTIITKDDENDPITYTLISTPPNGAEQAFTVGRFDGKITTIMDLRRVDREPVRELIIQVADDKENTVTCTIAVTITNMNEPPVFENLPATVDVPEDKKPNEEIFKMTVKDDVSCTDPIGLDWTVEPSGHRDSFTVTLDNDNKGASVKVAEGKELDHETEPSTYRFVFTARDGCLAEKSEVLTLNVKDVNEKPTFKKGDKYFFNVSEVEKGIIDLDCEAFDPDDGDELTLELPAPENKYFKVVDPKKCHIQLIGEYPIDKPDLEKTSFEMEVTLKDKAAIDGTDRDSTATATVTVNIWDYNDNVPLFDQPAYKATADIVGGDEPGKALGNVAATDKDKEEKTNANIEYYLQTCSNGGSPYVAVLGNGDVVVKRDPAGAGIADGTVFQCKIEARDKGIYPGTLSSTTLFDVVYKEPPPPTPIPVYISPATDATNGADSAAGAGAGAGASAAATASSSEDFLSSPAAIGVFALLGALLLALAIFLLCRFCCGNCGGSGGGCNGGSSVSDDYYSPRPGSTTSTSHVKINEGNYKNRPPPVMHP